MHLIVLSLSDLSASGAEQATGAEVADIIWAHAGERDGLEHVKVRTDGFSIGIALFIRGETPELACETARQICGRAISGAGLLADWTITGSEIMTDALSVGNSFGGQS